MRLSNTDSEQDAAASNLRGLEFVTGIAHDLKTPLATIATSAELLEQDIDGQTSAHLIKVIQRQAERLNLMVAELSEHLRQDSPDLQMHEKLFDLAELLAESGNDCGHLEWGHQLLVELPPEQVLIVADYGKIRRIVENLVRNAFKYTPSGTTVRLRLRASHEGEDIALIEVEDEGPGIPEEMRTRIFDAFFRLNDRPNYGQGLGLHVVKLLSEAHHGSAWVEPSATGGSIFCVQLPTSPDRFD